MMRHSNNNSFKRESMVGENRCKSIVNLPLSLMPISIYGKSVIFLRGRHWSSIRVETRVSSRPFIGDEGFFYCIIKVINLWLCERLEAKVNNHGSTASF